MENLKKIQEHIKFIEKYWYEKVGLAAILISVFVLEVSGLAKYKVDLKFSIAIIVASWIIVCIIWVWSRQPSKTPKSKVGFLVCIYSSDGEEGDRLREDFIIPLRQLVKSGKAGKAFHFMEAPQYIARDVLEPDDAQALRVRTRAHFILYGRVRLRALEGKDHHVLDLNGIVAHNPIPESVSSKLAKEFSELLPRRVNISTENDLLEFEITSEWADTVAKYIIGIAAALSGDMDYSESLYRDVLARLRTKSAAFPVSGKLKERIPVRLSELFEARGNLVLSQWVKTRDAAIIESIGEQLEKIKELTPARMFSPSVLNQRAIYCFLKDRNVDQALAYLKRSPDSNNGLWHYNVAFLYGYKGDLKSSIRHYRKASTYQIIPQTLADLESFICWVLAIESDKYQLHYCLGFFNWKTKGDEIRAAIDFRAFLGAGSKHEFEKERKSAARWLGDLEKCVQA